MAPRRPEVKKISKITVIWDRCKSYVVVHVDQSPRLGWYLTALLALNYIIDAAQSLF